MNKKSMVFVVVGLLLAGAGAGVGMFMSKSGSGPEAVPREEIGLLEMETFLANISSDSGERFAKLTLQLAVVPRDEVTEMEEDGLLIARMRDRVLTLLTSKSFEELNAPMGREAFRNEVRMRLSPLVEEGEVREVLFSEFIIQ